MHTIKLQLHPFSAAHRLIKGYKKACNNLHGHNYLIDVTLQTNTLDTLDFVVDFTDIKTLFGGWIKENWDHATLVSELDAPLLKFLQEEKQKHYVISGPNNTTAERLAEFIFHQFHALLQKQFHENSNSPTLTEVNVYETPLACAGYTLG